MTDVTGDSSEQNLAGWSDIRGTLAQENGAYKVVVPAHWKQGRTAYGGLTAALMLATAHEEIDDLPPLRSALVNFVGPVKENPTLTAQLERRGRNVTNVSAVARNGDQAVGRADFLFGTARTSTLDIDLPAPDALAPEDCEAFTPEAARSFVPAFFHNFDTRLIAGARPMMGEEGYIRTWSRHFDPKSRTGVEALLCLADVLPPAAMPLLRKFAPVSSMSWIVNFLTDTPTTRDGWWHVESNLTAARGGYSSQVMRIWNTDGELVVEGLQSIAIFDG
jgi:acyl-CoA thioesterase